MPKFDPMTGKPLENTAETPVTEEASVSEETVTEEVTKEEAAPEETVTQEAASEASVSETPVQETPVPQGTTMQFDPMTGKPVSAPKPPKKTSQTTKIIIGVVAGVLLLAIFAVVMVASGIFSSPKSKVVKATVNTFNKGGYIYDLLGTEVSIGDKYSVEATVHAGDGDTEIDTNVVLAVSGKEKQLSGTFEYDSSWESIPEIEFISQLTDKELKLKVPSLDDRIFIYNYLEEKDGAILDYIDEDDLQILDEALKSLYSTEDVSKDTIKKDIAAIKDMRNWYKSLKVSKIDAEEFEVDGKDRKCKGYELVLTEDDLLDLVDILNDYLEEKFDDALSMDVSEYKSALRELRSEIKGMDDLEIRFYVYKNMLAAIEAEMNYDVVQILFKGGDYRTQNIEVNMYDETVIELKGKIKDDKETLTLYSYDEEVAKVSYNKKSGKFNASLTDGWDEYSLSGKIVKTHNEFTVELDEMDFDYFSISGSLSVKKGATMDKLKGEEFDLGNADEDELLDLARDIYQMIY